MSSKHNEKQLLMVNKKRQNMSLLERQDTNFVLRTQNFVRNIFNTERKEATYKVSDKADKAGKTLKSLSYSDKRVFGGKKGQSGNFVQLRIMSLLSVNRGRGVCEGEGGKKKSHADEVEPVLISYPPYGTARSRFGGIFET